MKSSNHAILVLAFSFMVFARADAAPVDFTGVDLGLVSSPSGQNFGYTASPNTNVENLNVLLLSGDVNSLMLTTGSGPDTTGFYVLQSNSGSLTPADFRFSFGSLHTFRIDQNETLTQLEINSLTLSSGSWILLNAKGSTWTTNGSNITFSGSSSPPYGTYSIIGTGVSFDFSVTNFPGFSEYGSAISLTVLPEAPPQLNIFQSDVGHVQIVWDTNSTGYVLEAASTLQPVTWESVTNSPTTDGQKFSVVIDITGAARFFRLRKN